MIRPHDTTHLISINQPWQSGSVGEEHGCDDRQQSGHEQHEREWRKKRSSEA